MATGNWDGWLTRRDVLRGGAGAALALGFAGCGDGGSVATAKQTESRRMLRQP